MRRNRKLIVIIIVILILAIASAVFAYLYFMTDMFRSNQELFAKYFMQNGEMLQKMTDLKTAEVYKNLENESKYESNTNISVSYSEGGEISNPLNNLTAKLDVQKDNEQQYTYIDGQILYEDEEYLEAELIQEQNVYGIRFTDAIQQFITVENDENVDEVMSDIGLTTEQAESLIGLIEGEINSNENFTALKDKYLSIITSNIANGVFSKQKNAMITYNNNTINTNAYSVLLSSEQVENILIEILNNLKNETELLQITGNAENIIDRIDGTINRLSNEIVIPEIKITVYEYNKNTIRTVFDVNAYSISIENTEENGEIKTKINYSDFSGEQTIEAEIEISKISYENEENIEITANITEGNDEYTRTLSHTMQQSQGQINVNTEIGYREDITVASLIIENNVNIGQDFEKSQTLGSENSRSISSLDQQRRQELISIIENIVKEKINERIALLRENMGMTNNENVEGEDEMSQIEINRFNAKFEFYTGEEVSAENVQMLLDVVKDNMSSYELINSETSETLGTSENPETSDNLSDTTSEDDKINIRLNIEKDQINEQGINEVLEKIDTSKKYNVTINYQESNGLIEYISIIEI